MIPALEDDVYIKRLSAWAPGICAPEEWDQWAAGKKEIIKTGKGPDISFTEPLFRRRLSQISRMTVQVAHDLMPMPPDTKIFFFSFRGELSRQFQINKMLIEEKTLSPASFSLSVFNAPAALATMAMGLKGGYSCLYAGNNSFALNIAMAKAALLGGSTESIAFIYADEEAPQEYSSLFDETPFALSFGFLLSKTNENCAECSALPFAEQNESPFFYLKKLIAGGIHVTL